MKAEMSSGIESRDRLIVALDFEDIHKAKALVVELGNCVAFYKIGLQLCMTGEYFGLLDWLVAKQKKVFVDLKFFDIPATVGKAVKQLSGRGITFVTVHGNDGIMRAAAENKGDVRILAVTVLTSLDRGDLDDLGFECDVEALVLSRTRRAIELGCDGVVASGQEASAIRQSLGYDFLVVSPGIRLSEEDDDQKRVVTPTQALNNGADYIVVGRPITAASDPLQAAQRIQKEIALTCI